MLSNCIDATTGNWERIKESIDTVLSIIIDRSESQLEIYIGTPSARIYRVTLEQVRELHSDARVVEPIVNHLKNHGLM